MLLPWAIAPDGYRTDSTRPRDPAGVQPEPREAPIVQELFARYLEPAATVHRLVARLARDGVPTPSGRGCWRVGTVRYILRNPSCAGTAYGNRFRATPSGQRPSALQPVGAWERIRGLLPPQRPTVSRPRHDHRTVLGGIRWVLRSASSWREMPARFGTRNTAYVRYRLWRHQGLWQRIIDALGPEASPPSGETTIPS